MMWLDLAVEKRTSDSSAHHSPYILKLSTEDNKMKNKYVRTSKIYQELSKTPPKYGSKFNPYKTFHYEQILVLINKSGLNPVARLIYFELVRRGRNDKCYPSQTKLAKDCGVSLSAVTKGIKELVEYRFIESVNHNNARTDYYFLWNDVMAYSIKELLPDE